MDEAKRRNIGLKAAIGIAVILMAVNVPLVGLPGIPIFIAGDQPATAILGRLHGDNYWPLGFYMGFFWPPGIPIAYIVATRINIPKAWRSFPGLPRTLLFIGLLYAWIVLLATAFHLLAT